MRKNSFAQFAMALAALLTAAHMTAQTATSSAKSMPPVPRTADGKPDLNGVWQPGSDRPGTWEEANQGVGVPEPGSRGTRVTRGGPPPYQPWAAQKVQDSIKLRRADEPVARCIPQLDMPGISLYPIQFVQNANTVAILIEPRHNFRIIPLNAKHPDDLEPAYVGDSVGRWEGDTLVVDVTGFKEQMSGVSLHSDAYHVVERYTRVDYNTIDYEATVDDSKVLTKPYTIHSKIMLRPGTRIAEYVCEENNQDPEYFEKLLKDGLVTRSK
ncbi:MAG TPA: hypothetical protein VGR73_00905 [Bryobacteraceae bacterium]|nr:hypothetical protein [Bryobacteraceae bacterium]